MDESNVKTSKVKRLREVPAEEPKPTAHLILRGGGQVWVVGTFDEVDEKVTKGRAVYTGQGFRNANVDPYVYFDRPGGKTKVDTREVIAIEGYE